MEPLAYDPDNILAFQPPLLRQVGTAALADRLGLNRRGAEILAHTQLGELLAEQGGTYLTERGRLVLDEPVVEALEAVPFVESGYAPTVNVRVRGAVRVNDSDRHFKGWHKDLTDEQADLAVTRWWPTPSEDVVGQLFIATAGGFVVRAGRITAVTVDRDRTAFAVDTGDREALETWAGRRVSTPRGGTVVYLAGRVQTKYE